MGCTHVVEMDNLLCLGNNNTGKYLCMFGTVAILCPEYFQVMLDGETAGKGGHPRNATSLACSEEKGTECRQRVGVAWLLTGERQAFC